MSCQGGLPRRCLQGPRDATVQTAGTCGALLAALRLSLGEAVSDEMALSLFCPVSLPFTVLCLRCSQPKGIHACVHPTRAGKETDPVNTLVTVRVLYIVRTINLKKSWGRGACGHQGFPLGFNKRWSQTRVLLVAQPCPHVECSDSPLDTGEVCSVSHSTVIET